MGTLAYPFTLTAGQPENVNQLNSNLAAIGTVVNGQLDATNLATSAKPVTVLTPYRVLADAPFFIANSTTAATYLATNSNPIASGGTFTSSQAPFLITLTAADLAVSGLTTRLRVAAATGVSNTAPAVNFTFGLYPITFAGAGANITLTVGTVVSGSTVARVTPSASTAYQDASSDFAVPSNGVYALGIAVSGTTNGASVVASTVRLECHHV